jgi:hypothetical protein
MKARFVRLAATHGDDRSRQPSHSPAPGQQQQQQQDMASGPYAQQQPQQQPQQAYNIAHTQQSWNMSSGLQTPNLYPTNNRSVPNNPLTGISANVYDPFNSNISIMPPPSFLPGPDGSSSWYNASVQGSNPDDGHGNYITDDHLGGNMNDWLALPLNPLLNIEGADVTQSAYGPDVGGVDMLDVLLGYDQNLNHQMGR